MSHLCDFNFLTMAKYLDPKADLTFKKVFGEQKDLLQSFLNAVLPLKEGTEIESLEYLTPEMVPENPAKKYSIVDVRCKDNHNRQFIVEMQMYWTDDFLQRALFNTSKAYVRPLERGDAYDELRQVYCVSIINDIAFPNLKDEFYHRYVPANIEHPENTIKGFETIFLELPKFRPSSVSDKKMMVLWLRFLTEINESTKEIPAEMLENEYLSKAVGIVEQSAYTDAQRMAYDKFWDEIWSEKTLIKGYFRQGHAEGRAEGLAEGLEAGRAEGLAAGRAEGLAEGEKKGREEGMKEGLIKIANNMKAEGLSISLIAKMTGLSEEELKRCFSTQNFVE